MGDRLIASSSKTGQENGKLNIRGDTQMSNTFLFVSVPVFP